MSQAVYFDSRYNYMKRDSSSGSANMLPPTVLTYPALGLYTTRLIVSHNLGYVPFFTCHYEPFADGVIYRASGTSIGARYYNPRNLAAYGPVLRAWADTATLTLDLGSDLNSLTGTFPVYWVIYRDYGIT